MIFLEVEEFEAASYGKMVHVKGFASGLDLSEDEEARAGAAAAVAAIGALGCDTVVWDGDALHARGGSFTSVVERCVVLGARALAVRRRGLCRDERDDDDRGGEAAFERDWRGIAVACVLLPAAAGAADDFAALGLAALELTGAEDVVCLGGGEVTRRELELAPPHVRFRHFACGRATGGAKGGVERSWLEGLARPNLVHGEASRDGLEVRASRLAGAGSGLFAAREFARGAIVCEYVGAELRTADALKLADKSYLMRLGPQCYVDARQRPEVRARYVNDCRDARAYNLEFIKRPNDRKALVRATRDIAPGEELYVSYGKLYWLGADFRREPTSRLPPQEVQRTLDALAANAAANAARAASPYGPDPAPPPPPATCDDHQ